MGCAMRLVVPIRQNAEYTLVACDVGPRGAFITSRDTQSHAITRKVNRPANL